MKNKPSITEFDRKVHEVRTGQASAELHRIRGHWFTDSRGRVFRAVSLDQIEAQRKYKRKKSREYSSANMESISEVIQHLTNAQCAYLLRLQCNLSYNNGLLENTNGTLMTTKDMIKELGLSRKRQTFYDFLNVCLEREIIEEREDGYAINPKYHFKGKADVPYYIKAYTAKVKQVYKGVKAEDIGLIYRMLQFVHYSTNALCANPFETDAKKVRKFNRKDMAEALGISIKHVSTRLPKMKFGDVYVMAKVTYGEETFYMMNPYIFYRKKGDTEQLEPTLQVIFAPSDI